MKGWHLKTILREDPLLLTVGGLVDILGCFNDPYSSLPTHRPRHRHTYTRHTLLHRHTGIHLTRVDLIWVIHDNLSVLYVARSINYTTSMQVTKCIVFYCATPRLPTFVVFPKLSHTCIFCLHMSGIQVLLHWLWEQEDKWRCAALYFHVRILFFHLISLSSHSMWCRQWGNRKWKQRMECIGKEMKHRHGIREGMRPDCWWSLMKCLTRHNRMSQTEKLLHIHPHTRAYTQHGDLF